MGHITLGNRDIELYQDEEIIAWLNEHNEGYTLRDKTAGLWLAVLKGFDNAGPPMTVRQVFYALVSVGTIPKTERAYDRAGYHLLQMRRRGILPYRFIADNTRWMRKPHTYFFGDYDPSGVPIIETTEAKLRDFGADFHFEQVAVLPWQIEAWGLPTRPTKRSDSRAKNWRGGSVELDAVPVSILRGLVEEKIKAHIDDALLERTKRVEELERASFDTVIRNFRLAQISEAAGLGMVRDG